MTNDWIWLKRLGVGSSQDRGRKSWLLEIAVPLPRRCFDVCVDRQHVKARSSELLTSRALEHQTGIREIPMDDIS